MVVKNIKHKISLALAVLMMVSSLSVLSCATAESEAGIADNVNETNYGCQQENSIGKGVTPFADEAVCNSEETLATLPGKTAVPSYYNSAELGYVTPVKDQGVTYCCWSFSSLSALESDAIVKGWETKDSVDFSEAHLTWFIYNANTDEGDRLFNESANYSTQTPYGATGNANRVVAALARGTGLTDEEKYPFNPYNTNKMGNYPNSAYYDNNGYAVGNTAALTGSEEIKNWIMNHGSCIANIYCREEYFLDSDDGYSYYYPTKTKVNHSINIVGWDDNFSKDRFVSKPSACGAWICKNSYGTDWGDNGYFYLSYSDPSVSDFTGFEICKAEYENIYTYNANPYSALLHSENTISSANIFRIEKNELVDYVSFYTITDNETVTIELYQIDSVTNGPCSGYKLGAETIDVEYPGYHKARVFENVQLSPDTYYSVVIKTIAEGTVYVPVEVSTSKTYTYTKAAHQSFYSIDGVNWADASKYGNVYINLYTEDLIICNHDIVETTVMPTCTVAGFRAEVCSICGYVQSVEKMDALGHAEKTVCTDGTCTEPGRVTVCCERCDTVISETETDCKPHQYETVTVEATCTENGYTKEVCRDCGATEKETEIAAKGHTFVWNDVPQKVGDEYMYVEECIICRATGRTELAENDDDGEETTETDDSRADSDPGESVPPKDEKTGFFSRLLQTLRNVLKTVSSLMVSIKA